MPLPLLRGASTFAVLVTKFALLLTLVAPAFAQVLLAQHNALAQLYAVAGGPTWVSNTGWNSPYSGADHCSWSGVYCCGGSMCPGSLDFAGCTEPCAVWALSLANNNLAGHIDDDTIWDALDTLMALNLQGTPC